MSVLDRALPSEGRGHMFKSGRARQGYLRRLEIGRNQFSERIEVENVLIRVAESGWWNRLRIFLSELNAARFKACLRSAVVALVMDL